MSLDKDSTSLSVAELDQILQELDDLRWYRRRMEAVWCLVGELTEDLERTVLPNPCIGSPAEPQYLRLLGLLRSTTAIADSMSAPRVIVLS